MPSSIDRPPDDRMVDLYAKFLPPLIVERALTEEGHSDPAFGDSFHCSVMFADISGFTCLAESFARTGAIGPND